MTGVKYGGIYDLFANLLSTWLRRAKIPHMSGVGGFKRTCTGLFAEFSKQLSELDPVSPAHTGALRYQPGRHRRSRA